MDKTFINLTLDNIDSEHICCAISDKKHQNGVSCKKKWLKSQFNSSHVFRKLNERGKVFIEYCDIENAWVPILGENFVYIHCLWVAGSFKGTGYANELLNYCIEDAKNRGKSGICVLSSKKKKPYLSDKKFFAKYGFKVGYANELLNYCIEDAKNRGKSGICVLSSKKKKPYLSDKKFFAKYGFKVLDSINNEYELLGLTFDDTDILDKNTPHFSDSAKKMSIDENVLTIYYSHQCPFVVNSIEEVRGYCSENNIDVNIILVDSLEKAKNLPCVFLLSSMSVCCKFY